MSDVNESQTEEMNEALAPDERTLLMQRARMMGLRVSNNIGLETLKAKISEHMEKEDSKESMEELREPEASEPPMLPMAPLKKVESKAELRQRLMAESLRLVRLRITNLDPKKKDLPGEIFTVANSYIGTVKKYVPFGEQTENGYHVPYVIYEMMKSRKFLHIRTVKRNGQEHVETQYVPEFALEVLPQLTEKDLQRLANQQAAAAGNV